MPTANVYSASSVLFERFDAKVVMKLRTFLAERLSCGEISLSPEEVSVRLIAVHPKSEIMGDVEMDVHAHEFPDRIERQDELCLEFAAYIQEDLGVADDPRVWLVLSQLGHS